jgi:hypothetical protein
MQPLATWVNIQHNLFKELDAGKPSSGHKKQSKNIFFKSKTITMVALQPYP